ncbi:MFS general substrate transporter [Pyrrhoderma noxium]|uniref:MFS general substrate transporter n=1 Tax=Pyrrhoderma noxium TaxID=2282107 RepID=A0A286U4X6_9AGAM|nr:MFS general substrate transporter [Pyrrhoderma noxium]
MSLQEEKKIGALAPDSVNDGSQEEVQSPPKPTPGPTFPDGGTRAWMTVAGCFLLSFTSYGQLNAFGVFQAYYAQNQLKDHSASAISWIGSIQLGLTYIFGLFLGRAFDLYGSRKLLILGWLLSTFCLMMLSLSKTYYQIFLSHGLGLGIGIALQFYPLLAVPNHWFMKRRAYVLGIVVAGSSLSGVIFPIMLSRLFEEIGFPWTIRTFAFVIFALQGISIPFVKERFPPRKDLPKFDSAALKETPFVMHILSGMFISFGLYTPFWYIEFLFGRVGLGLFADKFGRFNVMVITIFICSASSFALWTTSHTTVELIFFAIIFGFTSGAYNSIAPSCTAQLTKDPTRIGARVGMFMTGMAPGIITGPSIAGAILSDSNGSYVGLACFVGAVVAFSGIIIYTFMLLIYTHKIWYPSVPLI